ncbi:MAG: beta-agarase [Verrucomicrobia bacterium]|nr:beta-agarase [Verrucomicrobiota bacterium]
MTVVASFGAICLTAGCLCGADLVLLDRNFDFTKVVAQDSKIAQAGTPATPLLRITTGHAQSWPGVTIPAPGGFWNLAAYGQVALHVKNTGAGRVSVSCRVDNPGADGTKNCVTGALALNPGQEGNLRVELSRTGGDTLGGKLFGMRGYPVGPGGKGGLDPAKINQLLIFVAKPTDDHSFEVSEVRATGSYTPPTASVTDATPFFPFMDAFGQYKHRDWPDKVHSLAELQQRREQETKELAAKPGPADWDKYGGWAAGPLLKATGFFRTEKHKGKWWLVDPEGRLFFSHGIDCVRMLDTTPIDERETWFENFPGKDPAFKEFLSKGRALKGHYAGKSAECFSFAGANLARKYGPDWKQAYSDTIHKRLRSWGLNTIANWSDPGVFLMRLTPYTDTIGSGRTRLIEGSEGYWGKFPDVFDPGFAAAIRQGMENKRGKSANDPWCIGYFSDNEMSWGDDTSLAVAALKSPPDQAAKKQFIADLKAKYADIAKLNAAWGANHASWDALLQARQAPDKKKAREDLTAFYTKAAETYFRTVREAVKAIAPNQLYLGCRFAWVNDLAAKAAGGFCDVVSYNLYRRSVAEFEYPGGDKPLSIGEFHFGALDRGLFHTGLVPMPNQEARAQAYKDYVLGAARHAQFVGTHWFQWKDEPVNGRVHDEENYQIGFLDVADTPYRETIEASRAVAASLYQARLSEK